jgi:hypothetical protein
MAPRMQSRALHMGFTTSTSPGILCCEQRVAGACCCPKLGRFLHPGATHVCIRLACAQATRSAPRRHNGLVGIRARTGLLTRSTWRTTHLSLRRRPGSHVDVASDAVVVASQGGASSLTKVGQNAASLHSTGPLTTRRLVCDRRLHAAVEQDIGELPADKGPAHEGLGRVTGHGVSLRRERERDTMQTHAPAVTGRDGAQPECHSVQSPAAHPASLGAMMCRCRCASQRRRSDRTPGAQLGKRVACPTATQGEWAGVAAAATGVLQLAGPRGRGRTRQSAARRPMHTVQRGHDERGSCLADHVRLRQFVS